MKTFKDQNLIEFAEYLKTKEDWKTYLSEI